MPWFANCNVFFQPRRTLKRISAYSMYFPRDYLLSLLLKHQWRRRPTLQLHSQLLISALYHDQTLCTALLKSYSLGCYPDEAIRFYKQILCLSCSSISSNTFSSLYVLKACASSAKLNEGTQFHSVVLKKGFEFHVYVYTALVDMYAACGALVDAKKAFDEMHERNSVTWNALITGAAAWGEIIFAESLFKRMPCKNVVSWTVMIDAYARALQPAKAIALFVRMMREGEIPTEITVLALVPAVSNLGALDLADSIHGYCKKKGLSILDVRVINSMIDMYAKCGSMNSSLKMFHDMSERRNLVSWTTIISGFSMHGMAKEAVKLFELMGQANLKSNGVTFLSVLNACNHGGLVDEGLKFFHAMVFDHGIEPEIKHYGCLVDMLGRSGRLDEAEKIICEMPMGVNVVVWRTLLGCCSKQGDFEMGERVMKRILKIERGYSGDYVVMSNILSETGRFTDAQRMRGLMDESNVAKVPGFSLVDTIL